MNTYGAGCSALAHQGISNPSHTMANGGGGGSSGVKYDNLEQLYGVQSQAAKFMLNQAMPNISTSIDNSSAMVKDAMDGTLANQLRTQAGNESTAVLGAALGANDRNMQRYGMGFDSNRLLSESNRNAVMGAANKAGAMNNAALAAENMKWNRNAGLYAQASGTGSGAMSGLSSSGAGLQGMMNSQNQMDAANASGYGQAGGLMAYSLMKADGGYISKRGLRPTGRRQGGQSVRLADGGNAWEQFKKQNPVVVRGQGGNGTNPLLAMASGAAPVFAGKAIKEGWGLIKEPVKEGLSSLKDTASEYLAQGAEHATAGAADAAAGYTGAQAFGVEQGASYANSAQAAADAAEFSDTAAKVAEATDTASQAAELADATTTAGAIADGADAALYVFSEGGQARKKRGLHFANGGMFKMPGVASMDASSSMRLPSVSSMDDKAARAPRSNSVSGGQQGNTPISPAIQVGKQAYKYATDGAADKSMISSTAETPGVASAAPVADSSAGVSEVALSETGSTAGGAAAEGTAGASGAAAAEGAAGSTAGAAATGAAEGAAAAGAAEGAAAAGGVAAAEGAAAAGAATTAAAGAGTAGAAGTVAATNAWNPVGWAAAAYGIGSLAGWWADGGDVVRQEPAQREDFRPGGQVSGPGTETSDDIPAWLSDGEIVHNADAVKLAGKDALLAINEAGRDVREGKATPQEAQQQIGQVMIQRGKQLAGGQGSVADRMRQFAASSVEKRAARGLKHGGCAVKLAGGGLLGNMGIALGAGVNQYNRQDQLDMQRDALDLQKQGAERAAKEFEWKTKDRQTQDTLNESLAGIADQAEKGDVAGYIADRESEARAAAEKSGETWAGPLTAEQRQVIASTKGVAKMSPYMTYDLDMQRANAFEKAGDVKMAASLREQATHRAAADAMRAGLAGDWRTFGKLYNIYPDGNTIREMRASDKKDKDGNPLVSIIDNDGHETHQSQYDLVSAALAKLSPTAAANLMASDRKLDERMRQVYAQINGRLAQAEARAAGGSKQGKGNGTDMDGEATDIIDREKFNKVYLADELSKGIDGDKAHSFALQLYRAAPRDNGVVPLVTRGELARLAKDMASGKKKPGIFFDKDSMQFRHGVMDEANNFRPLKEGVVLPDNIDTTTGKPFYDQAGQRDAELGGLQYFSKKDADGYRQAYQLATTKTAEELGRIARSGDPTVAKYGRAALLIQKYPPKTAQQAGQGRPASESAGRPWYDEDMKTDYQGDPVRNLVGRGFNFMADSARKARESNHGME